MDIAQLAVRVVAGDRRALAQAITLAESTRADHRAATQDLLARLATLAPGRQALRIGLTGTPGVGKSTFIEALGLHLTAQGKRLAVLAVDPSSALSGGSILGDKTRMERLAREPLAFIRPSPSQTMLGGLARRTREVAALCEASGADILLIETVGVGQSETLVAEVCDIFLLLLAPGGGDGLQGIKRGIMELADILVVNKADGALRPAAQATAADYGGALRLMRRRSQDPAGYPCVLTVSALTGEGLGAVWDAVTGLTDRRRASGALAARRVAQARGWFRDELEAELLRRLSDDAPAAERLAALDQAVAEGRIAPVVAAATAIAALWPRK